MSNDLNTNTAAVTLTESKPSQVPAPAATTPVVPAVPQPATNKKERYNKKSGGGFGGLPRTKL